MKPDFTSAPLMSGPLRLIAIGLMAAMCMAIPGVAAADRGALFVHQDHGDLRYDADQIKHLARF